MSDSAFVQHMGAATASPDAERSHGVWWDRGRLPSPISEDDDSLGKSNKTSFSDGEMAYSMSQPMSPPSCDSHDAIDPVRQSLPDRAEEPPHLAAPSAKKKVSFAMGYRADCDKCRQKVPGHYSHINWT